MFMGKCLSARTEVIRTLRRECSYPRRRMNFSTRR